MFFKLFQEIKRQNKFNNTYCFVFVLEPTEHDSDSSQSSLGCYDSDADEDYLPNEQTSSDTDGDEQTPVAGLRKPSKC